MLSKKREVAQSANGVLSERGNPCSSWVEIQCPTLGSSFNAALGHHFYSNDDA
jgi:hypothetical protein